MVPRAACLALLLAGLPDGGLDDRSPPQPIPEDLSAAIAEATRVGREIFEQDAVSAQATDLLLARVPGTPARKVAGWVTIPGPWWKVVFLVSTSSGLRVKYEMSFPRGEPPESARPSVQSFDPPRPLDEDEAARWSALQTVLQSGPRLCGEALNPVILSASTRGGTGWLVYLLNPTSQRDPGTSGGHLRYEVSQDGKRVLRAVELSQCGATPRPESGEKLFDAPNEGHVFVALSNRVTVDLVTARTRRALWTISPSGGVTYRGVLRPVPGDAGP